MKNTIVVWFSCGAASAVAAKLTLEKYGSDYNVRVVNNPIAEEDPDNLRFMRDVEKWLGVSIETAVNSNYPSCSAEEVGEKRRYMSGIKGAPCTLELKKVARQQWEARNSHEFLVLGFTADEVKRHINFKTRERSNILPVLIDAGLTKSDCFRVLKDAGIELPRVYKHLPNANCIGCVKATSSTYWSKVREEYPDVYKRRSEFSRSVGARLVRYKGKRLFLDELPEGAKGRPMKNIKMVECGIFCEEKV